MRYDQPIGDQRMAVGMADIGNHSRLPLIVVYEECESSRLVTIHLFTVGQSKRTCLTQRQPHKHTLRNMKESQ